MKKTNSQRSREMKRYWIRPAALFEYKPKGFPTFEIIKPDDIKDSLIVWHKVEDEGIPLEQGYYWCRLGNDIYETIYLGLDKLNRLYWQSDWVNFNDIDVEYWAEIIPPKE